MTSKKQHTHIIKTRPPSFIPLKDLTTCFKYFLIFNSSIQYLSFKNLNFHFHFSSFFLTLLVCNLRLLKKKNCFYFLKRKKKEKLKKIHENKIGNVFLIALRVKGDLVID